MISPRPGNDTKKLLRLEIRPERRQNALESRVSLAQLAIEEGHASDAETLVRAAQQQFHGEQQADDELSAGLVLIDALLAQGKQSEAQKEIEGARRLGSTSQSRFLQLQFELASGHVLLRSEHPEAAGPLLKSINHDAQHYGFTGLELANELALAEFAIKTKHGRRGTNGVAGLAEISQC